MSVEYTLYCDKCRTLIDASPISPAEVRRVVVREGSGGRIANRDLCWACMSERNKPNPDDVRTWFFDGEGH